MRRATNADAASIAHIAISAGTDAQRRAYSPKEAAAGGALFGDLVRLVACIGGQVVGTAQYCRREGAVELLRLEVHELHRGHGVARALVDRLASEAAAAGATKITLQSVREMGYEPLLGKLGFRTVAASPLSLIDSEGTETLTEITLERTLTPGR